MATEPAYHAPSSESKLASSLDVPATDNSLMMDMSTEPVITDPLFMHLSRTFTTRELVRLKAVCKTFATLVSDNMQLTAEARCDDDTKDWYFPLRLDIIRHKPAGLQSPWIHSWAWSGVHHSSGRVHRLPSLTHLPRDGIDFDDSHFNCLLASAGGLLLFMHMQKPPGLQGRIGGIVWVSRDSSHTPSQNWRPLLVSNPLTKQWRELPAADCRDVGVASWDYGGARAYMVVDEKANAYKVILYFRNAIIVYKSTSYCWSSWSFPEPIPGGFGRPLSIRFRHGQSGFVAVPSAIVGAKLYFAELEVDGSYAMLVSSATYAMLVLTLGHVIVFEVDEEARKWSPPTRYPLGNYFPNDLHDNLCDYGFCMGSYVIAMAECMGGMYTVIPAKLNIEMDVGDHIRQINGRHDKPEFKSYGDFGYLPLRFYILQLQGVGLPFGQLLIQIPHGIPQDECKRRKSKVQDYAPEDYSYQNPHVWCDPSKSLSWFRCTARGSVIWVAFADYLLQYDVVSGRSTTRILPVTSFGNQPDLSYRPSFHMKP